MMKTSRWPHIETVTGSEAQTKKVPCKMSVSRSTGKMFVSCLRVREIHQRPKAMHRNVPGPEISFRKVDIECAVNLIVSGDDPETTPSIMHLASKVVLLSASESVLLRYMPSLSNLGQMNSEPVGYQRERVTVSVMF